jgi:1-acyl-sn-glycerol-3-phosphate acyltransferase
MKSSKIRGILSVFGDGQYRPFTNEQRQWIGESQIRLNENWRLLVDPVFFGHENIPTSGPTLWVGNHSLLAFADLSLMLAEVYRTKGVVLRGLGDHIHFKIPIWRTIMGSYGAIDGTPDNCTAAMQAGDHILVFPGGGDEVLKRERDKHRLLWKKRTGFARLAIESNCPIVPFAAVGADDCWDVVLEHSFIRDNPVGRWLYGKTGFKPDQIPPVVKGIGPTPIPRPERIYFKFFPPLSPAPYRDLPEGERAMALRQAVERIVQGGIAELLAYREQDPLRTYSARLAKALKVKV